MEKELQLKQEDATSRDIAERNWAEEALRESEEKFRLVIDYTYDWESWIDPDGNNIYVSPSCERITGHGPEEFYREPELLIKMVHPDDRAAYEHHIKSHLNSAAGSSSIDFRIVMTGGETRWIGHLCQPVFGRDGEWLGRRASNRDITDRKQAEMALQESEKKFRVLAETSPAAIFLYQGEKYLYVNPMAETLTGYSRDELLTEDAWGWIQADFRDLVKERARRRQRGEQLPTRYEVKYRSKDGREGWVDFTAGLVEYGGKPAGLAMAFDVSNRKRAEEALRASEKFLNNVFDGIQDGISVLDKDLNIIRVNHVMEEWYPYMRPLIGKKCYYAYHEQQSPCEVCPSLRAIELKTAQSDIVPFHGEDGKLNGWLEIFAFPLHDNEGNMAGVIEHIRDITERKRVEDTLSKSQFILAKSQEMAHLGNWAWNVQTGEMIGSDENYRIYGCEPGEIRLSEGYLMTLVHPEDRAQLADFVQSVKCDGVRRSIDYCIAKPDGTTRYVMTIADKIVRDKTGMIKWVYGITQDITERKLYENALEEAKNQAELYLDLMGHDINNMHQIALGYLELARDMHPEAGENEFLNKPIEVLQRSARLIRNVRKLQKLRDGAFKTELVDVCQLLVDVQREYGTVPHKLVTLNLNGREHCLVRANELLHDVFANLVGNAIKHTGDRADIVVDLDVVWNNGAHYCRVMVEDNGPGIPDDFKGRIFHRMLKGDSNAKGMGLGLYLVKSLVESYGGRVWVEDRVLGDYTKGARFVVMLPAIEQ